MSRERRRANWTSGRTFVKMSAMFCLDGTKQKRNCLQETCCRNQAILMQKCRFRPVTIWLLTMVTYAWLSSKTGDGAVHGSPISLNRPRSHAIDLPHSVAATNSASPVLRHTMGVAFVVQATRQRERMIAKPYRSPR